MTRAYFKLCMENVIMKLRCSKKHHFVVNHALGTMFTHFVFKWNGFVIPTWLAHGTEYMQPRMHHEFSCFPFCFCFVEENARITRERTWKQRYVVCRTKSMLNAYAWWCNDSCKMWCWNMICSLWCYEEMLMRCMIWMHLRTWEPGKLSLLTCAFKDAVPHVCS